jgi:serine phosphatase RsbU (regulator of sigma subunit)/Tfp pilus assembly protein PilF
MVQVKQFLSLIIFFFSSVGFSQLNLDSLKSEFKKSKNDTVKCNLLESIIDHPDCDDWSEYNLILKKIAEENIKKLNEKDPKIKFYKKHLGLFYNNLGFENNSKGEPTLALENFLQAVEIQKSINDLGGLSGTYNNLGFIYKNQGDIEKSLDYYFKSLKIKEELNNKIGVATTLNNIAIIYSRQKNYDKAISFFKKSLKIEDELENKIGFATTLNNIGNVYNNKNENQKALDYYWKSLKLFEEANNRQGIATTQNHIGFIFEKIHKYQDALDYYLKSLKISEADGYKKGIVVSSSYIAKIYHAQNQTSNAIKYAERSLKLSKELGFPEDILLSSRLLFEIHKKNNNYKDALIMHELYTKMKDSIDNISIQESSYKQQYKYEFEKRETVLKAEQEKKEIIYSNQSKRQKITIISIASGLFIVIVFSFFLYKRFKITEKQKEIISLKEKETERQKNIVETKNKEILDSIAYAKRIQAAILPSEKLINSNMSNNFIYYKPKDIVAGDFYWLEPTTDGVIFAAADCTGHGVPGAMVSVVCHNALNRAVREFGLKDTGKILDKTKEIVIAEFEKSDDEVQDGMDISICHWNKNTMELTWSGANNPLWIIRNKEILIYSPDKQPIGKYSFSKPFTSHKISLQKDDLIYIFTDGYQDQFGNKQNGNEGKKFKTSRLKELLHSISEKPMAVQSSILNETFENWKGELEQVDDVCIIGIRV